MAAPQSEVPDGPHTDVLLLIKTVPDTLDCVCCSLILKNLGIQYFTMRDIDRLGIQRVMEVTLDHLLARYLTHLHSLFNGREHHSECVCEWLKHFDDDDDDLSTSHTLSHLVDQKTETDPSEL